MPKEERVPVIQFPLDLTCWDSILLSLLVAALFIGFFAIRWRVQYNRQPAAALPTSSEFEDSAEQNGQATEVTTITKTPASQQSNDDSTTTPINEPDTATSTSTQNSTLTEPSPTVSATTAITTPTPTTKPPPVSPTPTMTLTPTPTSGIVVTNTPLPSAPCPVQLESPNNYFVFKTSDQVTLRWSSPGGLGPNDQYRLTFSTVDSKVLNALLTKNPFSIKRAHALKWTDENGQWIKDVVENGQYLWAVAVMRNEVTVLCESDEERIFTWKLSDPPP